MEAIKVLIIEDNAAERDSLCAVLTANNYTISGVAPTFKEALNLYHSAQYDVVIIDVFLDGQPEGIAFAETISRPPYEAKPFVFLTSSKDRQIFERAKLTKPFGFLLKPFNELEVLYAIEMAIEKFYSEPMALTGQDQSMLALDDFLFLKKNKSLVKVQVADISHVEVEERYCTLYTSGERFVVQLSLAKIQVLLEPFHFLRVHRNYLINSTHILRIDLEDDLVVLSNEQIIPVSEQYRKDVLALRSL